MPDLAPAAGETRLRIINLLDAPSGRGRKHMTDLVLFSRAQILARSHRAPRFNL